jgi:hypothetical protein
MVRAAMTGKYSHYYLILAPANRRRFLVRLIAATSFLNNRSIEIDFPVEAGTLDGFDWIFG